jgi:hypothetical protein
MWIQDGCSDLWLAKTFLTTVLFPELQQMRSVTRFARNVPPRARKMWWYIKYQFKIPCLWFSRTFSTTTSELTTACEVTRLDKIIPIEVRSNSKSKLAALAFHCPSHFLTFFPVLLHVTSTDILEMFHYWFWRRVINLLFVEIESPTLSPWPLIGQTFLAHGHRIQRVNWGIAITWRPLLSVNLYILILFSETIGLINWNQPW